MASVSSLDKDLRRLRLDKYTPQASKEARDWIEEMLGDKLQDGDLLEALKDGLALCRLINQAVSPGVRAKQSNMPFVQRENISHFVRACQNPPLSLPDHDIFLTDDLYDSKDPAQVLQCIVAFSRRANAVNPSAFPRAMGSRNKASFVSPQSSGTYQDQYPRSPLGLAARDRGNSNTSDKGPVAWNPLAKGSYSGQISPTKGSGSTSPSGNTSSWSKQGDQRSTAPAWNIHQYGYMGGASQGNQGISFGAPRQITSSAPSVPNMAEKERRRREEQETETQRQRVELEEAERQRRRDLEAEEERAKLEEERAKIEEEQRWQDEARKLREQEKLEAQEEQKRKEEDQERRRLQERAEVDAEQRRRREEDQQRRQREEEEEARLRQEREAESHRTTERPRPKEKSDTRLRGQLLSQYQSEHGEGTQRLSSNTPRSGSESQRIAVLERQLELAKERERQYQLEREQRSHDDQSLGNRPDTSVPDSSLHQSPPQVPPKDHVEQDWQNDERESLQREWKSHNNIAPSAQPTAPRPLPDPAGYAKQPNRTDRYLSSNPAPTSVQPQSHRPADFSTTTEVDLENQRRKESQAKTKAGGWASKSLLEKEMERERERQREWEEGQKQTSKASRDGQEGAGPGKSWDVHQYGYMGGDSQNKGGPGLGVGGARRQIIGPRPPP